MSSIHGEIYQFLCYFGAGQVLQRVSNCPLQAFDSWPWLKAAEEIEERLFCLSSSISRTQRSNNAAADNGFIDHLKQFQQ